MNDMQYFKNIIQTNNDNNKEKDNTKDILEDHFFLYENLNADDLVYHILYPMKYISKKKDLLSNSYAKDDTFLFLNKRMLCVYYNIHNKYEKGISGEHLYEWRNGHINRRDDKIIYKKEKHEEKNKTIIVNNNNNNNNENNNDSNNDKNNNNYHYWSFPQMDDFINKYGYLTNKYDIHIYTVINNYNLHITDKMLYLLMLMFNHHIAKKKQRKNGDNVVGIGNNTDFNLFNNIERNVEINEKNVIEEFYFVDEYIAYHILYLLYETKNKYDDVNITNVYTKMHGDILKINLDKKYKKKLCSNNKHHMNKNINKAEQIYDHYMSVMSFIDKWNKNNIEYNNKKKKTNMKTRRNKYTNIVIDIYPLIFMSLVKLLNGTIKINDNVQTKAFDVKNEIFPLNLHIYAELNTKDECEQIHEMSILYGDVISSNYNTLKNCLCTEFFSTKNEGNMNKRYKNNNISNNFIKNKYMNDTYENCSFNKLKRNHRNCISPLTPPQKKKKTKDRHFCDILRNYDNINYSIYGNLIVKLLYKEIKNDFFLCQEYYDENLYIYRSLLIILLNKYFCSGYNFFSFKKKFVFFFIQRLFRLLCFRLMCLFLSTVHLNKFTSEIIIIDDKFLIENYKLHVRKKRRIQIKEQGTKKRKRFFDKKSYNLYKNYTENFYFNSNLLECMDGVMSDDVQVDDEDENVDEEDEQEEDDQEEDDQEEDYQEEDYQEEDYQEGDYDEGQNCGRKQNYSKKQNCDVIENVYFHKKEDTGKHHFVSTLKNDDDNIVKTDLRDIKKKKKTIIIYKPFVAFGSLIMTKREVLRLKLLKEGEIKRENIYINRSILKNKNKSIHQKNIPNINNNNNNNNNNNDNFNNNNNTYCKYNNNYNYNCSNNYNYNCSNNYYSNQRIDKDSVHMSIISIIMLLNVLRKNCNYSLMINFYINMLIEKFLEKKKYMHIDDYYLINSYSVKLINPLHNFHKVEFYICSENNSIKKKMEQINNGYKFYSSSCKLKIFEIIFYYTLKVYLCFINKNYIGTFISKIARMNNIYTNENIHFKFKINKLLCNTLNNLLIEQMINIKLNKNILINIISACKFFFISLLDETQCPHLLLNDYVLDISDFIQGNYNPLWNDQRVVKQAQKCVQEKSLYLVGNSQGYRFYALEDEKYARGQYILDNKDGKYDCTYELVNTRFVAKDDIQHGEDIKNVEDIKFYFNL
ncbi:hypothetical protein PFFVO_05953 [Plasmodium falciparum Vietnam Oak-Knoll (FVO)]|uniref:Uncharacterized protein n=1 Tax=Plasmodium falciparum Vietnam Oak-Knoll (FVO) TaxID=1036723 RepID=A0A024UY14_PLAFA|nr:hypothetical protein PFFVO_05953 [Plasmodium falciparum Vietnam Oak-Knoll (FVO)]